MGIFGKFVTVFLKLKKKFWYFFLLIYFIFWAHRIAICQSGRWIKSKLNGNVFFLLNSKFLRSVFGVLWIFHHFSRVVNFFFWIFHSVLIIFWHFSLSFDHFWVFFIQFWIVFEFFIQFWSIFGIFHSVLIIFFSIFPSVLITFKYFSFSFEFVLDFSFNFDQFLVFFFQFLTFFGIFHLVLIIFFDIFHSVLIIFWYFSFNFDHFLGFYRDSVRDIWIWRLFAYRFHENSYDFSIFRIFKNLYGILGILEFSVILWILNYYFPIKFLRFFYQFLVEIPKIYDILLPICPPVCGFSNPIFEIDCNLIRPVNGTQSSVSIFSRFLRLLKWFGNSAYPLKGLFVRSPTN